MAWPSFQDLLCNQLRQRRLPAPEREYRFDPPRRFRFDLAWPPYELAFEIDGGTYGMGPPCKLCHRRKVAGHTSIERLHSDLEKLNLAAELGWRVLRYTPGQ